MSEDFSVMSLHLSRYCSVLGSELNPLLHIFLLWMLKDLVYLTSDSRFNTSTVCPLFPCLSYKVRLLYRTKFRFLVLSKTEHPPDFL